MAATHLGILTRHALITSPHTQARRSPITRWSQQKEDHFTPNQNRNLWSAMSRGINMLPIDLLHESFCTRQQSSFGRESGTSQKASQTVPSEEHQMTPGPQLPLKSRYNFSLFELVDRSSRSGFAGTIPLYSVNNIAPTYETSEAGRGCLETANPRTNDDSNSHVVHHQERCGRAMKRASAFKRPLCRRRLPIAPSATPP